MIDNLFIKNDIPNSSNDLIGMFKKHEEIASYL